MKTIKSTILILALFSFVGCSTTVDPVTGKKTTKLTPAARQAIATAATQVGSVALATIEATALNAATQELTTGKINTKTLETVAITSSVSAGSAAIRSLQATAAASSGSATSLAMLSGATSPAAVAMNTPVPLAGGASATLATTVSNAVASQVAAGVPPNLANETVATALDGAVAASPKALAL